MKDKVSIIIVIWNGKKWLKKCIQSLEKQTYKNIEILVVDNGSTDNSVGYLEKNFPKVSIIKNGANLGLSKANNIGIKSCKGEYLLLMNNDTWVKKDFVEKLFKFYRKNDYSVIAPRERRYFNNDSFKCNTTIDITGSPAYYFPEYKKEKLFYLSVCFFCSKKEYLESGGMDENFFMYNEDVDWFWRLTLMEKAFMYADVDIHHAGAGSTGGSGMKYTTFLWRNQNTLQTLLKNYSSVMLLFVLPIYFVQNAFEIIFFLIILKPSIAYSYIQGWIFNIHNLKRTLKKRRWIQKHRKISDLKIMKKMYPFSGKLLLMKDYLQLNLL